MATSPRISPSVILPLRISLLLQRLNFQLREYLYPCGCIIKNISIKQAYPTRLIQVSGIKTKLSILRISVVTSLRISLLNSLVLQKLHFKVLIGIVLAPACYRHPLVPESDRLELLGCFFLKWFLRRFPLAVLNVHSRQDRTYTCTGCSNCRQVLCRMMIFTLALGRTRPFSCPFSKSLPTRMFGGVMVKTHFCS